jgi:hypothetical protein
MKTSLHRMLLAAGLCLATHSLLANEANKTYFSSRNELQQNGRLWAGRAPGNKTGFHADGAKGITADVSFFASESKNTVGLGKHFGASARADFSDAVGTVNVALADDATTNALVSRQVDHTYSQADTEAPMAGKLKLRPWQKRRGAMMRMHGDLGVMCGWNGWHIDVSAPLVQVKNNLGAEYVNATASVAGAAKAATTESTLANLFAGNYVQSGGNAQQALEYGLVTNEDQVKTGIADVKVMMGYDIAAEVDGTMQLRAGLIVPTGNQPDAKHMLEAVYGNGRHFGLALGMHGDLCLWENAEKKMSWWFTGDMEYTYLFSADEKRIAGLHDVAGDKQIGWGHMVLAVEKDRAGTFPLANVIARQQEVTPGSHYEGILGTSVVWKNMFFNLGYNVFFRRSEEVKPAQAWPTEKYGLATYAYDAITPASDFTATAFTDADKAAVGPLAMKGSTVTHIDGATVLYQVDPYATAVADQEVHAVLGGIGLTGVTQRGRYTLSLAGAYEFPANTAKALKGWSVSGRLAWAF